MSERCNRCGTYQIQYITPTKKTYCVGCVDFQGESAELIERQIPIVEDISQDWAEENSARIYERTGKQ